MVVHADRFCYLCGVPFTIRRCRTANEPESDRFGETVSCVPFQCGHFTHGRQVSDVSAGAPRMAMGMRFMQRREHISVRDGPSFGEGYNGYRIKKGEVEGINQAICIKVKPTEHVEAAPTDELSSIDEDTITFITGVGTPRHFDMANIEPARYGVRETCVDSSGSINSGPHLALPVHVACFEVFKKVSADKLGKVDIDGLYRHSRKRANPEGPVMRRGEDLRSCRGRNWVHKDECEYLAANPTNTPTVGPSISPYVNVDNAENFVFTDTPPKSSNDPFHNLPRELRDEILLSLDKRSAANLRLSSSAFTSLPQCYFRSLVELEMPWLWELEAEGQVDWYNLYLTAKQLLREVKGLKNRERIWRDVSFIVDGVKDLNEEMGDTWEEEWLTTAPRRANPHRTAQSIGTITGGMSGMRSAWSALPAAGVVGVMS